MVCVRLPAAGGGTSGRHGALRANNARALTDEHMQRNWRMSGYLFHKPLLVASIKPSYAMQPPSRADPESGLRNALAIAIVQQKRRQTQELHQLREKCVRVEAQLQQEQRELQRAGLWRMLPWRCGALPSAACRCSQVLSKWLALA